MSAQLPRGGMEQTLTQFAVIIICDDSTSFDEMGDYVATETDSTICIVCEADSNKDWL